MGSLSIVRASAGSGKTYLLAVEYIASAMSYPTAFRSILAVTFTNKATAEMKRRILTELSSLARGEQEGFFRSIVEKTGYQPFEIQQRAKATLAAILKEYSSFSVSTIDKFFQRIVRSFFRELGLDLHYQIEIDSSETLAEAIDAIIDKSYNDEALARKINRLVAEELDAGHRVDPHGALSDLAKSILSEEYTTSIYSDQEVEDAYNELKTTYQTACSLLRHKAEVACKIIDDAGLSVDDFKSKNRGFASYFSKVSTSRGAIPPYTATFKKTATSSDPNDYATKATIEKVRPILPQLMEATLEVMNLYDQTLTLRATFAAIAQSYSRYTLLRHLSSEFSLILSQRGELSLSKTTKLIASIVDGAEVPFIFERLGSRYSTIFIDEFQDTSLGQWEGFLPLLHEAISKCDKRCVMLIGDIKQAIYRFRGGDWRLLGGGADAEFQGFLEESQTLNTSWRSDRKIVEFNNAIMRRIVDQANNLVSEFLDPNPSIQQTEYLQSILLDAYSDMEQQVPDFKGDEGYVETYLSDKTGTLDWVVTKVKEIATRYPLSRAAVLVRKKSEGDAVAEVLLKNGINIISDELLTVGSSKTASFVVNILRYASQKDEVTLAAINRFLNRQFTDSLHDEEQNLLSSISSMTSMEAFETIIRFFNLQHCEPFYLQSLYNLIYKYLKDESSDIGSFVEAWDRSLCKNKIALPEVENAIRIMTIHKAKGLEFDAVLVPFFSWELFPTSRPATTIWCNTEAETYQKFNPLPLTYNGDLGNSIYADQYFEQGVSSVVDNVNLIYVAITRAKSELYLGLIEAPRAKTAGGLLVAAVNDYLVDCQTFGQLPTKINQSKNRTNQGATIEFCAMESYPAPPLSFTDPNELAEFDELDELDDSIDLTKL